MVASTAPSPFSSGSPPHSSMVCRHSSLAEVHTSSGCGFVPFGRGSATSFLPGRESTCLPLGSSSPCGGRLRFRQRPPPGGSPHPVGGGSPSLPVWWRVASRIPFNCGSPPSLPRKTRFDPSPSLPNSGDPPCSPLGGIFFGFWVFALCCV